MHNPLIMQVTDSIQYLIQDFLDSIHLVHKLTQRALLPSHPVPLGHRPRRTELVLVPVVQIIPFYVFQQLVEMMGVVEGAVGLDDVWVGDCGTDFPLPDQVF